MKTSKLMFYAVALVSARKKKEVVLFAQREESLNKVKWANADAAMLRLYGYNVCVYSNENSAELVQRIREMKSKNIQCILHSPSVPDMVISALLLAFVSLKSRLVQRVSKLKKALLKACLEPSKSF